jgi:alpha-L-fucosidase 2
MGGEGGGILEQGLEMKTPLSRRDFVKASAIPVAMSPAIADTAVNLPPAAGVNVMTMQYPAAWPGSVWREAMPCGNGKFGAAVYGSIQRERILFNHEDLWDYAEATEQPDIGSLLPRARRLLQEGKRWEANDLYIDKLRELGYRVKLGALLPLADLVVSMPSMQPFRNYRRQLDMATGEALVTWREGDADFERRLFVSRVDDVIVYWVRSSNARNLNATFGLVIHDLADAAGRRGVPAKVPLEPHSSAEDGFLLFQAKTQTGGNFGVVARVAGLSGKSSVRGSQIALEDADGVLILIKLFAEGDPKTVAPRLKRELSALPADYTRLLAPHAKAHGELFQRVKLNLAASERDRAQSNERLLLDAYGGELPAALVEKMWAYGRYLFISSCRPGGQPPSLLGRWCGEYEGFWTFNMANINIQMIYWQVLAGNLTELNLTLFDYYESMMDQFRKNAKNIFGCRGIMIPAPTTPRFGEVLGSTGHVLFWTGGAAWLSAHYYDHYRYTGDRDFLRNRALPFMREAAHFYEDYTFEDETGLLMFAPSNSPENAPGGYTDRSRGDGQQEISLNAAMDIALCKELLTNLLEGATESGMYLDEVPRWKGMLSKLPPYMINQDGAIKEWSRADLPDHYEHRHLSHMYAAFPGREVGRDHPLYPAFRKAVDLRLSRGMSSASSWSLMHTANILARWRDGDAALEALGRVSRTCIGSNLFTYHNDWRPMGLTLGGGGVPPFQIDANMGWTAAVQNMLLASDVGKVAVLPALPSNWRIGEISGLRCRGGITASLRWDTARNVVELDLATNRDQTVDVSFPKRIRSLAGSSASVEGDTVRGLHLNKSQTLRLRATLQRA